jgi:plasmid stabilization system protein ParE
LARLTWTREAEVWLHEIHEFIGRDKPETALGTVQSIYQRAQVLKVFPESGYRYQSIANRHIRILLHGHYRIAYLVKDSGDIDILGVFHGALDISRFLQ